MAKHDLIFFEKRSTPKVVSAGQKFRAPESYGRQTKRRPATEEEEKVIARGDWLRVDQKGKKGGQPGYKKTRMVGRQHLVQHGDVLIPAQTFDTPQDALVHYGVKGMKWGVRKSEDTPYPVSAPKAAGGSAKSVALAEIKSLEKASPSTSSSEGPSGLTSGQKKALYFGLGALATAAVVGGVYATQKNKAGDYSGHQAYSSQLRETKAHAWGKTGFYHKSSFDRPEFTIPPGHVFDRISTTQEKTFGSATYTSHTKDDFNRYLGEGFGRIVDRGDSLYHVQFKTTEPLRVPKLSTTLDTLRQVMEKDRGSSVGNDEVMSTYTRISGGYWDEKLSVNLFSALKSKGYGAIVDEMDAGTVSDSPLIVFSSSGLSSKTSSRITPEQVNLARKDTMPLKNPKLPDIEEQRR